MQIAPGIYSTAAGKGRFMGLFPPMSYLVVGKQAALIDAGEEEATYPEAILKLLQEVASPPLAYILVTHGHPDHWGGIAKLRQATGARALLLQQEKPELEADMRVEDGFRLDLGGITIQVIHTPGHTAGSACYLALEPAVLFTGDNVLGMGSTVIRPKEGDMAQYIASLEKLLALDIKLICPGHGPVIKSPQAKLRELIQHRQEREAQVLACLDQGKGTVEDIMKEIYPELDSRLKDMAQDQVLAHLAKLEREGRVAHKDNSYFISSSGGSHN